MYLPELNVIPQKVVDTNEFRGINDTFFIPEGYFRDMENTTSDYYPLLGTRKQRMVYETKKKINGVVSMNDDVYMVLTTGLYKNGKQIENVTLEAGEKNMFVYGAYIVIFPDKVMYNTKDGTITKMTYERTYVGGVTSLNTYLSDIDGNRIIVLPDTTAVSNMFTSGNMKEKDKKITDYITSAYTIHPGYDEKKTVYYQENDSKQDIYKWSLVLGSKKLVEEYGSKTSYPVYYGTIGNDNSLKIESYSESLSMWSEIDLYITLWRTESSTEEADNVVNAIKKGDYIKMQALDDNGNEIKKSAVSESYWNFIEHFKEYTKVDNVVAKECDVGMIFSNVGADFLSVLRDTPGYFRVGSEETETTDGVTITERRIYSLSTNIGFPWGDNTSTSSICRRLKVEKGIPDMDYMTVSNNRIWGCSNDKHEIYACKQGDATSWYCYAGLANDSYAVTIGSEGEFTGACTYNGEPYFFKEDLIICMYGTKPSNYQLSESFYKGVEKGSAKSICYLNGYIYYKSRDGIVRFDGSTPVLISEELGEKEFETAVAGTSERKYYVSMLENSVRKMFVYDSEKGMWHKENDINPNEFFNMRGSLFAVTDDNRIFRLTGREKLEGANISDYMASEYNEIPESKSVDGLRIYGRGIKWYAETGLIENNSIEHKYIQRLGMRYELARMASLTVYVKYDNKDVWNMIFSKQGQKYEGTSSITFKPRRCEKFRLKFEGEGECRIHSIQRLVNEGSEGRYGNI